ncbi:hypothetical protein BDV38DRAFT_47616 [Aspergillus pseudotamarii]|uniref:Secreted protein n=1 Tax=Aspergillus pseudotamarii TaxID=132259 RepID=A0A5N6T0I9_ASPPS|nr:uncharacterized protein BDV38DRAFT_47616 [Aspergillus pseudotamarii]KAE8139690.1 hypothetical protein BDV38DRAFT_47616 [Aspergillus pseudotamarii]
MPYFRYVLLLFWVSMIWKSIRQLDQQCPHTSRSKLLIITMQIFQSSRTAVDPSEWAEVMNNSFACSSVLSPRGASGH